MCSTTLPPGQSWLLLWHKHWSSYMPGSRSWAGSTVRRTTMSSEMQSRTSPGFCRYSVSTACTRECLHAVGCRRAWVLCGFNSLQGSNNSSLTDGHLDCGRMDILHVCSLWIPGLALELIKGWYLPFKRTSKSPQKRPSCANRLLNFLFVQLETKK